MANSNTDDNSNEPPSREDLGADPAPINGEDLPNEDVPEPAYTDDND
jgi:hypothetical protein